MSGRFTLHAAGTSTRGRRFDLAKFRGRVPALEDPRSDRVQLTHKAGRHDPDLVLEAGKQRYEGTREAAGANALQSSSYVAMRVDPQTGNMTMIPLGDWYAFKPAIFYNTIDSDHAEELMKKRGEIKAMHADERFNKRMNVNADAETGDPDVKDEAVLPDDDAFDDGAGPEWTAKEERDEDGNDGLDMEDEDLFDDDEDDGLNDDDEVAFQERKRHKEDAAAVRQQRRRVDDDDAVYVPPFEDDEDEDEGEDTAKAAMAKSAWGRQVMDALEEEKKAQRKEHDEKDDDDDDDDESELDAAEEARQKMLRAVDPAAGPSGAPGAAAGGKRTMSPSSAADGAAKRAKQAAATAAAVKQSGAVQVNEADVVNLLHTKGKMPLKDLIKHFKPYFDGGDQVKKNFIAMVGRVANVEENSGGKLAKLKETTLVQYQLRGKD